MQESGMSQKPREYGVLRREWSTPLVQMATADLISISLERAKQKPRHTEKWMRG